MAMTILHVYRGGMGDAGGDGGGSGEKVLYVGSAPPGYRQQYYRHVNAERDRHIEIQRYRRGTHRTTKRVRQADDSYVTACS